MRNDEVPPGQAVSVVVLGFEPGTAIEVGCNVAHDVIFGLEPGFLNVARIGIESSFTKSQALGLRFFASYQHVYFTGGLHLLVYQSIYAHVDAGKDGLYIGCKVFVETEWLT